MRLLNCVPFDADFIELTQSLINSVRKELVLKPFPIGSITPSSYSFDSFIAVKISLNESDPRANVCNAN